MTFINYHHLQQLRKSCLSVLAAPLLFIGCSTLQQDLDLGPTTRPYQATYEMQKALNTLRRHGIYRRTPDEEVYKQFDRNKDGKIDTREALPLLKTAELFDLEERVW